MSNLAHWRCAAVGGAAAFDQRARFTLVGVHGAPAPRPGVGCRASSKGPVQLDEWMVGSGMALLLHGFNKARSDQRGSRRLASP